MEQPPYRGGDELARQHAEAERPRVQRYHFGPWVFNVNKAQAIIAESPREALPIQVESWARFYGLDAREGESFSLFGPRNLDRGYAMTSDLDEPLLIATLRSRDSEEFPLLIDGTHRLYRACVEHLPELQARVLSVEETLAIREDGYMGSSIPRGRT